jgi:hypothetical protein
VKRQVVRWVGEVCALVPMVNVMMWASRGRRLAAVSEERVKGKNERTRGDDARRPRPVVEVSRLLQVLESLVHENVVVVR